jgi:hypothetical protein
VFVCLFVGLFLELGTSYLCTFLLVNEKSLELAYLMFEDIVWVW